MIRARRVAAEMAGTGWWGAGAVKAFVAARPAGGSLGTRVQQQRHFNPIRFNAEYAAQGWQREGGVVFGGFGARYLGVCRGRRGAAWRAPVGA